MDEKRPEWPRTTSRHTEIPVELSQIVRSDIHASRGIDKIASGIVHERIVEIDTWRGLKIVNPGFSERTFEFCYNAEYCQSNAALLATHPHIPSQNADKDLGYDVEFRILQGHYTRSLFLQHKVPSFAEVALSRN
jgi:hypothetical protein